MQKVEFKKIPQLDFRTNEAFKTLRTNITFCGDDQRVILLPAPFPTREKLQSYSSWRDHLPRMGNGCFCWTRICANPS